MLAISASMSHRLRHYAPICFALLILSLLLLLFFWRLLTPSLQDRYIFASGDFTQHYYAFADYQVERLNQGQFPLWNPYNHAGDPFAGNIQFAAFYPPRYLMAFLVGRDGYSIEDYELEVALHYWLASVMMFALLRVITRRPTVALFGSVLYAYSGYLTGYPMLQVSVLESAIWLPLMLLGAHLSVTRPGWRLSGGFLGGIGIALSLFGGHPQTTLQLTYLTIAYLLFMAYQERLSVTQTGIALASLLITGGGISAVQLLPALEFTRLSYRVTDYAYTDKANGFLAADLFQMIIPGAFGVWSPLYLGAAGLLLAVGAILRPRPVIYFWGAVIVIGVFLSLGKGSIVYDAFYLVVPGINIFRQQERIASVVSFAGIMLAVDQVLWIVNRTSTVIVNRLDSTIQPNQQRYRLVLLGYTGIIAVVCLVTVIISLFQGRTGISASLADTLSFTLLSTALFTGWFIWQCQANRNPWQILAPLLLLVVIDTFTIGTRTANYLPDLLENRVQLDSSLQAYRTASQDIAWRIDGAAGLEGNGVYFRIPDIYGTGPFTLATTEYLRHIPVERFWEVLSARYVTTVDEPPSSVPLNLLAYGKNTEGQEFKLFELQNPRPMAHLVYDYRQAEGSAEFAREIMSDARVNLREMAVTLYPLPFELPVTRPEVSRVDSFRMVTPEQIEMTVSTGADALLTVAIVNYPGWRATINGQPADIVDTYAGLIGIPIRAGENQVVTLSFVPQSVLTGAAITTLTLLIMVLITGSRIASGLSRRHQDQVS